MKEKTDSRFKSTYISEWHVEIYETLHFEILLTSQWSLDVRGKLFNTDTQNWTNVAIKTTNGYMVNTSGACFYTIASN